MEIIAKEMERNGIRVFSRRGVFKIIELAQSVLFVSLSHDIMMECSNLFLQSDVIQQGFHFFQCSICHLLADKDTF